MRIVWLAAADARGHLMRAHLMSGLLGRSGVEVEVVTTNEEGRRFLAALGTPARVLSCHYGVAFDAWQNLDRARTEHCVLRYLLSPRRGLSDLQKLEEFARGADAVVNDFHPLLLVAGAMREGRPWIGSPVIHVYGENLWRAVERHFEGRGPALLDQRFGALARALRDRGFARVEHALGADPQAGWDRRARSCRLPPIIASPKRSPSEVRAALGLGPQDRLAAVYLNPHFADPALPEAIERALLATGSAMYAVGEGFSRRPGWRAYDPAFADVVAASDLLISAPGMGALGLARLLQVPLLATLTDQPEQRANVACARAAGGVRIEAVALPSAGLEEQLLGAMARLRAGGPQAGERRDGRPAVARVHARWTEVFLDLAGEARARRPRSSTTPISRDEVRI